MPFEEAASSVNASAQIATPQPAVDAPARKGSVHLLPLRGRPARRRRHLPLLLRLGLIALAGAAVGGTASYLLRKLGL